MTVLTERYTRAIAFTLLHHQRQTRKQSTVPYFTHLIGVSSVVLEFGGTEDQAIAGLLHDTLEDISGDLAGEIAGLFGEGVLEMVQGCTDLSKEKRDQQGRKASWYQRKESIIFTLTQKPETVLLVALSDKHHNARNLLENTLVQGDLFWDRFNAGKWPTLWYYRRLRETLRDLQVQHEGLGQLLQVFEYTVQELERVNGVLQVPTEELKIPLKGSIQPPSTP